MKRKSITLIELVNYIAAAGWQGYCLGSASPFGDWDPDAEAWTKKGDAAEQIITDFFFGGDKEAALAYICQHGEYKRLHMGIGDIEILKKHPTLYDEISTANSVCFISNAYTPPTAEDEPLPVD